MSSGTHLLVAGFCDADPRFQGDNGVWVTGGQDLLTQAVNVLQLHCLTL